ncbi:MAG: CbiX/SirB N-terminal domain-containing protein [Propionibacteriaceae bacterium]|nr:CbiX/SirB N-terminal domain-containing protein [Propionibacteriaceae bacterium]
MSTPLLIAAHGTRVKDGEDACFELARLVQERLPEVPVSVGFVELSHPPIPEALTQALLAHGDRAVVVPLMLGTGGHVRADIPEFIDEARAAVPGAHVDYAAHLGPHPRLLEAVEARLHAARGEWTEAETTVVFIGRGALVPDANADHVRLGRMLFERGEWADVETGFIQVTRPSLPEALDKAYAQGARRIVVMGHWLFPGRLRTWTFEQAEQWAANHPDAEVRVAEVIGACDELADVVVERYLEMLPEAPPMGSPTYLAGLLLRGRDVLVIGGGKVSERRVPRLLEAGARVRLVSPELTPSLRALAEEGRFEWVPRAFLDSDLGDAWYVLAATNDPAANRSASEIAELHQRFCVRADDAASGSAWTPATADAHGLTVAVIGNRDPRLSRAVRDAVIATVAGS